MKDKNAIWLAPDSTKLPDFIIGGMMKCGTTTIHDILDQHPAVSIPKREIHFFDIDDLIVTPDFHHFNFDSGTWLTQDLSADPSKFWDWYYSKFETLNSENQLIGEDSASYLYSALAAKRIAQQVKPIKLIFTIRQPTSRAFSHYCHNLTKGTAIYTFEDYLTLDAHTYLTRGLYNRFLNNYYQLIPKERIKVVLFEDLVEEPRQTIKEICEFLDLDFSMLPDSAFNKHSNPSVFRKSERLQLWNNRQVVKSALFSYLKLLPGTSANPKSKIYEKKYRRSKLLTKIHNLFNRPTNAKKAINSATKEHLDRFYFQELQGIDELLGKPILSKWFPELTDNSMR